MSSSRNQSRVVSVVIPVRNEVDDVVGAIRSALAQRGDFELEVIVADGASRDGTRAAVGSIAHDDPRVQLVPNEAGVTPAGLNAAIVASRGEVIVRCDAHSVLPDGYILRVMHLFDGTGADVVGGRQMAVGEGLVARSIAIAMTTPLGIGRAKYHLGGSAGPVESVYLGSFRRSTLERMGLFDESLIRNQDYELNHRIRQGGGVVYFDPELSVAYSPRRSLKALWSQYHQYGAWKRVVLRRFPESLQPRQLAPPLLVVGLVTSGVMAALGLGRLAVVVPLAYAGGGLVTTLVELARRRDIAALLLPAVLPTMHLAWALGFMASDIDDPGPQVPSLEPLE